MKITSVDVILLKAKATVKEAKRNPTVVRINTDEGLCGIGEIGLSYGNAKDAAIGMVKDFGALIIGMDPMNNEKIWEKLYRTTFWGMGGGTVIFSAMSAIDIALWDLKGKVCNLPIYQLLGGKTNPKIRAYASQIQFDWGPKTHALVEPQEYAEAARKAMAEGYTAVKVDPLGVNPQGIWMGTQTTGFLDYQNLKMAVDRVAAIRDVSNDLDIIVEMHALTDTNSAVQFGQEIEQYRILYYEEPTSPLNQASMKYIAEKVNIPIAAGERIYTRWGFREFLENHSLAVIQPDVGNCGGVAECKKICDMAYTYDIGVQIHAAGGPYATAVTLQLEAVIPNFIIHEVHASTLLPENIALCKYDYRPENGFFTVPELPGVGQELSDQALATADIVTVK